MNLRTRMSFDGLAVIRIYVRWSSVLCFAKNFLWLEFDFL